MKIELDRYDLERLVHGSQIRTIDHPLAIKAGHQYYEHYGRTTWYTLNKLTDEELWQLYQLCKNK